MKTTDWTRELRDLERKHQDLDQELKSLHRHAHLTPSEHDAANALKKRKLQAKDQIANLRRAQTYD